MLLRMFSLELSSPLMTVVTSCQPIATWTGWAIRVWKDGAGGYNALLKGLSDRERTDMLRGSDPNRVQCMSSLYGTVTGRHSLRRMDLE